MLSQFAKFKPARVHRSRLKNAPYNPRVLDPVKEKRLRANLSRVGLVEPIIWNTRTGNIVGGHQRLAALDVLEGSSDYELDVSAVELDDKTEREQNVFLNNLAVQGDWDIAALHALFTQPGFDTANAGFDPMGVTELFKDTNFAAALPSRSATYADAKPVMLGRPAELLAVFASREQREGFMRGMGLGGEERYIDAARILAALGVEQAGGAQAEK